LVFIVSEWEAEPKQIYDGRVNKLQYLDGETKGPFHMSIGQAEAGVDVTDKVFEADQVGYVLEGAVEFIVEGRNRLAQEGDTFMIRKGEVVSFSVKRDLKFVSVRHTG